MNRTEEILGNQASFPFFFFFFDMIVLEFLRNFSKCIFNFNKQ